MLLVGVTVEILVYILQAHDPNSVGTLVQTVVGLVTTACTVAGWLWARRQPTQASRSQVERAADELAEQVRQQWERAAAERQLMYPTQIPIRWRWSHRQVTGPVAEATGGAGGTRFVPLSGMVAITAQQLRSGTLNDLLDVYGGLDSGRLIILGGPGTGKTSAAIRLLLDALKRRAGLEKTEERARFPVPVLFTLRGWDPERTSFVDWLVDRLEHDYEFLTSRGYGQEVAVQLVDGNYLIIILDGLDEIPDGLRPTILRALNEQATFRLVLLARSDELVAAVSGAHLIGAAALELCPVESRHAAGYLARGQIDSASRAWRCVIKHLCDHPRGVLAQALDTPLMITLVRDTYSQSDPVDELIDNSRFGSRETIEDHLLDRVLPVAYAHRTGRPVPPYTLQQAQQWLGHLARRMNDERTRDVAWWQFPRWAPVWPRALVTALVIGLVAVLVDGILEGLLIGFRQGYRAGFDQGVVFGLVAGVTYSLVFGLIAALGGRYPPQPGWLPRDRVAIRRVVRFGVMVGIGFGLANGFLYGRLHGFEPGFQIGLMNGLLNMVVVGLAFGLLTRFAGPSVDAFSPVEPRSLWRRERQRALKVGLVFGLVDGVVIGFQSALGPGLILKRGFLENIEHGFVSVLGNWFTFGFGVMMVSSVTWMTMLASVQLRGRGKIPVRFLRFLEDAHGREVLRSVGPLYQFRHARLQDRLAGTR